MLRYRKLVNTSSNSSDDGDAPFPSDQIFLSPSPRRFQKRFKWKVAALFFIYCVAMYPYPKQSKRRCQGKLKLSEGGSQSPLHVTSDFSGNASYKTNTRSSYHPRDATNKTTSLWEGPTFHILNTRFMQHQGNLTSLGRARILLFMAFCLPTIERQTSQDFLWIIRTDPHLEASLKEDLAFLLRSSSPRYFLVGTNDDERNGSWRGGDAPKLILEAAENGKVYAGDLELIRAARNFSDTRILLETRLDADDGLQHNFMEFVQREAVNVFHSSLLSSSLDAANQTEPQHQTQRWSYWCVGGHIYWKSGRADGSTVGNRGELSHSYKPKYCPTPGLTVGLNVGTPFSEVPRYAHNALYKKVHNKNKCGSKEKFGCLHLVSNDTQVTIRARSPTSAGMAGIFVDKDNSDDAELWELLLMSPKFKLNVDAIKRAQAYFNDHLYDIVQDNLKGQCTKGHSCKESSKNKLRNVMQKQDEQEPCVYSSH